MKNINEINYMLDPNIDERIKNICQQAENNYILNITKQSKLFNPKINEINKESLYYQENNGLNILDKTVTNFTNSEENLNNNFFDATNNEKSLKILSNKYNNQNSSINNVFQSNQQYYYTTTNNNINSNRNQNLNKFDNLNSNRNKSYNKLNKNKIISKRIRSINKNAGINLDKEMIDSINSKIMFKSNKILSPKSLNFDNNLKDVDDDIVNYNSQLLLTQSHINHKNNSNYNSFLSGISSFCFECDLHKLINDKNIYNKDLNNKAKENKEINHIILLGKTLLQKNQLNKAYKMLDLVIKNGIIHPDLFYLYGEVCRKLKYMEDSEKYLLSCLDYKNCSPYVYLSLAQLYKEIGQIKYSKNFYKKCLIYFKKSSIYYNLGINYIKLNKPLKALNSLNEAINLEPNQPLYYKYRSDIYKSLGHNDLCLKDVYKYNSLINKN